MGETISTHPIKITVSMLVLLLASIAFNVFNGSTDYTNVKRDVEQNTEAVEVISEKLDKVYEGLLAKGIIEPKK